ncbi:ATP-grasp peptide maturase system methyltransferase [Streptomyces zhihengii]|uniref:ATP-grasp peptide maturase system methyltransferase n=1 Tax=Streptomyces zhihengii TaxID=1818004 RepID=UPI0034543EA0
MSSEEQTLRFRLARTLSAGGQLRTRAWRTAVESVPRHEFLRDGSFDRTDGPGITGWAPVMSDQPLWLERCYENESLITQIAGTVVPRDIRGTILRAPTSSSTLPGLVVRMWEELEAEAGHRVLEIGTGTGYSTALACQRLGADLVTSIELDPDVAGRARTALARTGHHPTLVTGDGLLGHSPGAPYDRVIATCGLRSLPYAWVEQTRPGGVILATLGGWLHSSELARLTVSGDGETARGRFLGGRVSFMPARPQGPPPIGLLPDLDGGDERESRIAVDLLDDWDARFVAQIAAPRAQRTALRQDGREQHVVIDVEGRSWAALRRSGNRWLVRQGGPDHLWDDIEDHLLLWHEAGTPALERFEVTVSREGQKITW